MSEACLETGVVPIDYFSHLHKENLPRKRNEMLAQLSAKLSGNMVDGREYLMRMCLISLMPPSLVLHQGYF